MSQSGKPSSPQSFTTMFDSRTSMLFTTVLIWRMFAVQISLPSVKHYDARTWEYYARSRLTKLPSKMGKRDQASACSPLFSHDCVDSIVPRSARSCSDEQGRKGCHLHPSQGGDCGIKGVDLLLSLAFCRSLSTRSVMPSMRTSSTIGSRHVITHNALALPIVHPSRMCRHVVCCAALCTS